MRNEWFETDKKIPSAKEKVASEPEKAILSRKDERGRNPFFRQCGNSAECLDYTCKRSISDSCERWTD